MKYGGIYKIDGDYALRMGESLYFLSDGISDIEEMDKFIKVFK